jgi:DNA-binding winged helix-turn-helix (wHTH) protein
VRARFADCVFDSERHELLRDGTPVDLTPKTFALLQALINAHPSAISKEGLYEQLWPGTFVEIGNLHTLIAELRDAVGDDHRQIIRTVHRFGYALAAEVSTEDTAAYLIIGSREIPLRSGDNVVGRDTIGSPDVSRRHARISVRGDVLDIEDLGSKNGTWVGGQRVESATLHDGDEIVLGRTRAVVRLARTDVTITATP